jgi:hypothetical protein
MANLPIKQLSGRLRSGEIFEDVGHLAWVRNPVNAYRTLTTCNDIHGCGVHSAARSLGTRCCSSNERHISTNFRTDGTRRTHDRP